MKSKRLTSFLLALFIFALVPKSYAASNSAGNLLATDIGAYINGCKIPSYNVNGYTAIVAEDLASYGFSVVWNDKTRLLTVSRNDKSEFSGISQTESQTAQVGKKIGTAYYTDIRTFVKGITVLSYNIGGKTAIFADALSLFGTVEFSEATRSLNCTIDGLTYKKPLVTITDSTDTGEINTGNIDVPTPPVTITDGTAEYYSNGVVPDYEYVTGVKRSRTVDKTNNFVSYVYVDYIKENPDKYAEKLLSVGFNYDKTVRGKGNEIIYYYTKGNDVAVAISVDASVSNVTITCKK